MKVTYLAVFTEATHDERGFTVTFPDVSGAITEGDTVEQAVAMAEDALGMMLCTYEDEGKPLPAPSTLEQIPLEGNQLVKPVSVDLDRHRQIQRAIDSNPIRWAREHAGLNIKELSEYLGAPYRTVQDWNNGTNRPPRWCEKLIFDKIMELKD